MEGYAYSYPDSGDSSPRSREVDFENPPSSWDEQNSASIIPPNHKMKFMVSYGGKIQPRSHDNLLSYIGGETKILAVERSIKFPSFISKLAALIFDDSSSSPVSIISSFKYQLPGEDLDALISVTNDDDLDHMMHEYDRLFRASPKPARLRLFVQPTNNSSGFGSSSSDPGKIDRQRFVEAFNSVPDADSLPQQPPPIVGNVSNNVDFLFGLENKVPVRDSDRVVVSDPVIDARIQELNRLQIAAGDGYQKPPTTIPASVQIPAGYWQAPPATAGVEQQRQYQPPPPAPQQQPVYMIHSTPSTGVYHAPVIRPVTGQPTHGYYQMQRVLSDPIYREQPVYSMASAPAVQGISAQQQAIQAPAQAKLAVYSEGTGVQVRHVAGVPENTGGYQVAYDGGSGRQVYYAAAGGGGVGIVTAQYQAVTASAADGKVVQKVTQTSV